MMIFLTISLDQLEIDQDEIIGFKVLNFGEVYLKYEISISDDEKYTNRQKYLAKEISLICQDLIIVGNPCYDLKDVNCLNKELEKYDLSLDTIYIPTEERIKARVQKAIEEQRRWGYREGITDEEIESNFRKFEMTLREIKEGLQETSVKVIEV